MSPAMTARPLGGRFGRWIGAGLLVHFAVVLCVIVFARGAPEEVLWVSHVSLLLAGAGLVSQSTLAVTTALTMVGVLHGLWMIDSLPGLLVGRFPVGATRYLLTANLWTWIATSHHFYLAPLLAVIVYHHRAYPRATLPLAILLFLALTTFGRAFLAPATNVNYAYHIAASPEHALVARLNSLDPISYLLTLNAVVAVAMFAPVALLMRHYARSLSRA